MNCFSMQWSCLLKTQQNELCLPALHVQVISLSDVVYHHSWLAHVHEQPTTRNCTELSSYFWVKEKSWEMWHRLLHDKQLLICFASYFMHPKMFSQENKRYTFDSAWWLHWLDMSEHQEVCERAGGFDTVRLCQSSFRIKTSSHQPFWVLLMKIKMKIPPVIWLHLFP